MYREGEWVLDKPTGKHVQVSMILNNGEGIAVKIGKTFAVRFAEDVEPIPVELQYEDFIALQHLAVETNDKAWFDEISERMGAHAICKQSNP